MALSKQIQTTLRRFHLDRPEATWEELRDHLKDIAEDILATPTEWERMDSMGLVYSDVQEDLYRIAVTSALTHAQAQAVTLSRQIMRAAQDRVLGDPRGLVGLIDEMNRPLTSHREGLDSLSLSVGASKDRTNSRRSKGEPALTFEALAGLYMAEQESSLRDSTLKDIKTSCRQLVDALGPLDLRRHTRADLIGMRGKLGEGRKVSTVNKLLTRLSTVLAWGVNNGYLEKTFDKKLKIARGSESSREAFTQEQVRQLMAYVNGLPVSSWERWALSLAVITGARLNEISQLRNADVREIGSTWVIDLNTDDGKSLKNKHSVRVVPLIDGAYGFDLGAFLGFINGAPKDGRIFNVRSEYVGQALAAVIRKVLQTKAGGSLTFHSLRHSLASLLKEHEVQLTTAQGILGHSSQSITFDLYGGGQRVSVERLADVLRKVFEKSDNQFPEA